MASRGAKPACSVLLPARNAALTLPACLTSVRAQTEADFELVAVNDHSTDDTFDLLHAAACEDPRIRVLDRPARGLVAVLNAGLAACRAPLVARMDADDIMLPTRLEEQLEAMRAQPNIAVLATQVALIETDVTAAGQREYVRWQNACISEQDIANQRFVEAPLAHPSVMYRRDLIAHAGGYRHGDFAEDYDLWLRLLADGQRIAKLPRVLLRWRDGPARLSRTDPRCTREAFDRLRAHYLARDPRVAHAARGVVVWGAGRRTRQRVRHLQDLGIRVRRWIDIDPRKIGNVIDGARVIPPTELANVADAFVLSYVANHGARADIGHCLERMHRREGVDWISVG